MMRSRKQLGGFVVTSFSSRQLRLRRHKPPAARRIEHGRAIPAEVRPHALQCGDGRVETCELLLDRVDDAVLFGQRSQWHGDLRCDTRG